MLFGMMSHRIDLSNFDKDFTGKSSYIKGKYSKVFNTVCILKNPKKIAEFGILDGYSLDCFIESTDENCAISAYDIFEEFPYNSAKFDRIKEKYNNTKVTINKANLFDAHKILEDKSLDIIHIDIANDGEVYSYCFEKLMDKIKDDGVMMLEGGSEERDNIKWMVDYKKPKIRNVLEKYKSIFSIKVFNEFPSLTLISKKKISI